jgi:peptide/nickel transport system substrate-binding protein
MRARSRRQPGWSHGLPRRRFLQLGSGLVGAAALAACGSSTGAADPSSSGAPVHSTHVGGRIRIAFGGNAGTISLDPGNSNRVYEALGALYGYLVQQGMDGQPEPDLAVKWSSNETADQWTFTLRQGVTFHNGQPFTSADVVYTFRNPENG